MKKAIILIALFFGTSVLTMAADKVVVIPIGSSSSNTKVWGEGREGVPISTVNTSNGVTISISNSSATWDTAASACPKNTWVCSESEAMNIDTSSDSVFLYSFELLWIRNICLWILGSRLGASANDGRAIYVLAGEARARGTAQMLYFKVYAAN